MIYSVHTHDDVVTAWYTVYTHLTNIVTVLYIVTSWYTVYTHMKDTVTAWYKCTQT